MNVGLWALNAAKKGRRKPVVPGSSEFILEETASNLRATKDAKTKLKSSLETSVLCLNELIASINNEASYEELIIKIDSTQPPPDLLVEESYRTSSTWAKSDGESLDFSSKPDLLLQNSERIVSSSALPTLGDHQDNHPDPDIHETHSKHHQVSPTFSSHMMNLDFRSASQENTDSSKLPKESMEPTKLKEPQLPEKTKELPPATYLDDPRVTTTSSEKNLPPKSKETEPSNPPEYVDISPANAIKVKMELISHDHSFQKPSGSVSPSSPPDFPQPQLLKEQLKDRNSTQKNLDNFPTSRQFNYSSNEGLHSTKMQDTASGWTRTTAPGWIQNSVPDLTPATNTTNGGVVSDPSSLSPIKLVNGRVAPTTSPNVDLSFIPIAKTVDPGNLPEHKAHKSQENDESNDSDHDIDNSFQAISTAIRKSFAGKTSMGNHSGPSISNNDPPNESDASKPNYPDFNQANEGSKVTLPTKNPPKSKDVSIKFEHGSDSVTSPPNLKYSNSRTRSFYNPRHTASIFVTLPNKESITLHAVNSENSEESENQKNTKGGRVSEELPPIPTNIKKVSPQADLGKLPSNVQLEGGKGKLDPSYSEEKLLSPQIPKLFSVSTFSEAFPATTNINKSSLELSKVLPRRADKGGFSRPSDRFTNRTTIAGSPVRRTPVLKPRSISRSPSKVRTSGSSNRLPVSSSVNSSRSPTKYGPRATPGSSRGSPTKNLTHQLDEPRKTEHGQNSQKALSSTLAAGKTVKHASSEKEFLKNRFLTTSLLPDNNKRPRKSFHPEAAGSGLAKFVGSGPSKLTKIENTSKNLNNSLKAEPKLRPKITLNFHSKQDLKPVNDPRSAATRVASSPEKKDRAKVEKLQTTFTKGMNTLSNPTQPQIVPRKRAFGNAVPLPDAARGKLRKENVTRAQAGESTGLRTPSKAPSGNSKSFRNTRISKSSPDHLPDIPSDDELLRSTKYLKSWAETPEILRVMNEKQMMDPKSVFGECADLDMSDIFRSIKGSSKKSP
ncbi:hypothetical protein JCM33374_g723 [Metschnikowia sp. JCM 33374]|nr:hypothetical protein JCM33374_g723 [Metschnikowia sp. JCM 33374]